MAEQAAGPAVGASSERGSSSVVVPIAVAAIGGLIVWMLTPPSNEQIERRIAASYLQEYYAQVVRDRDNAWNMLTPEYRSGIRGGRTTYDAFFGRMREVRVSQVSRVSGNRFVANLIYVPKTGRPSRPEWTEFELVCSLWVNKAPFVNCRSKDITISDTSYERVR